MWLSVLLCAVAFGIAFGMTGVGSVFAVPILTYVIGLPPHQAVCVAMVSVTSLSAITSLFRSRGGDIDWRKGLLVASAGLIGAPIGAWASHRLSPRGLMLVFAICVAGIALRLLLSKTKENSPKLPPLLALLFIAGFAAGFLAGLLGLGGVLVVPALALLGRLEIHRAIATSFFVIFAIGATAITFHFMEGQRVPYGLTFLFAMGGLLGLILGHWFAKRLPSRKLEVIFALAMLGISFFILAQTLFS